MNSSTVHLLAGGIGGTAGAIVTCPLEVVKIRLQSSNNVHFTTPVSPTVHPLCPAASTLASSASPSGTPTTTMYHARGAFPSTSPLFRCSTTSTTGPILTGSLPPQQQHFPGSATSHHRHHTQPSVRHVVVPRKSLSLSSCIRLIVRQEGVKALFKGIGPTLVGVLPSRAIYFYTYHSAQVHLSPSFSHCDSPYLTIVSAGIGGMVSSTITNPIWYVKTRLQLDSHQTTQFTAWDVVRATWRDHGWRGFYRGVQASYVGVSETAVHFVLYEHFKRSLLNWEHRKLLPIGNEGGDENTQGGSTPPVTRLHKYSDMGLCMLASACSKTIATTLLYPHEVIRTRLREDGGRYQRLVQTWQLVVEEEGIRGLYRGLMTHYVRQIPNACVMIGVYEAVVFLLNDWNLVNKE